MQIRSLFGRCARRVLLPAVVVALVLLAAPAALAASGDLSWSLTADSPVHWDDYALAVAPGPDGTVYAAGSWADSLPMWTRSDLTLLRLRPATSATGAAMWQRTWDDPLHHRADWFSALATDPAGNAIVTGTSSVTDTDSDIVIVKWRPNGRRAWTARYASPYGMADYPRSVACDGKGNVYVAALRYLVGNEDGDWLVMKFRSTDGKRLWMRAWSGTEKAASDDRPADLVVDVAGNSYSVGYSDDANGVSDAIIMKRTPGGKLAWLRRLDRSPFGSDDAQRIVLAGDKLYVAGVSGELANRHLLKLKYSTGGKRLWMDLWDSPNGDVSRVSDLAVDRAGNAVAVGACSFFDVAHPLIASWSATGRPRWASVDYPTSEETASAEAVVVNRAGTTWVAGYSSLGSNTAMLLKFSATGNLIWPRHLSIAADSRSSFHDVCLWGSGSLAAVGQSTNDVTETDLLVARYVR